MTGSEALEFLGLYVAFLFGFLAILTPFVVVICNRIGLRDLGRNK